jgi:hypothetical protein
MNASALQLPELLFSNEPLACVLVWQAMNAAEAREMYQESLRHPHLVTQVVPSPLTFKWDATIQDIIKRRVLGDLIYVEVGPELPGP